MPIKKDKKKTKTINAKGSTKSKQEQKKKGVKQSQSLVVNVNLSKGGKKKGISKPVATQPRFLTIQSQPQYQYQPQIIPTQPQPKPQIIPTQPLKITEPTYNNISLGNLPTKPHKKDEITKAEELQYNYDFFPANAYYASDVNFSGISVATRKGKIPVAKTDEQKEAERIKHNEYQREYRARKREEAKNAKMENEMMGLEDVNVSPVVELTPTPIKRKNPRKIIIVNDSSESLTESDLPPTPVIPIKRKNPRKIIIVNDSSESLTD